PPQIQGNPQVPYPVGAEGDTEVLLTLTIQKDGIVKSVEVAQGQEPFATAAKEAAMHFRFRPGTRNGEPVAARIRFAVAFHQTKVETPAPEEPAQQQTPQAEPGKPAPAIAKPKPKTPE